MMRIKRYSAGVMLALAACATTTSTPSIYYKTQAEADVALAAFDKDNPDCQLWTNWQKMCSRTGDGGRETTCTIDSSKPVKPSAVFCYSAKTNEVVDAINAKNPPRITSANRYCLKHKQNGESYFCSEYSSKRPFSGHNLTALRSPLCATWAQGGKGNGKLVCHERAALDGVPHCANLTVTQQRNGPFYCAKVNEQREKLGQCSYVSAPVFYKKFEEPKIQEGDEFVALGYRPPRDSNVHGLSCRGFRGGM
jgi:hypothetical protein